MKRQGIKRNTIEEIRIKSKIKNLVHGMLKNMTLPDGIESAETIIFCLRKLPDCQSYFIIVNILLFQLNRLVFLNHK